MKAFHEVRNYASDFMVWHSNYTNISFLAHWHQEIELIYIRSGSAKISVTDHIFTAHEGDLVICDSGHIHYSNSYDMDNSLDFIIFDTSLISSLYKNSQFAYPLITKKQLDEFKLTEKLHELLQVVSTELKEKKPYYQDIVKSVICEFWYLIKRNLPKASDIQKQSKRNTMLYDFQQLLSYLDEHYADNISLELAAEKMNFSVSHFSKIFKKLTGINYVTYLSLIRVEHAASQLQNTNNKIATIALNCGFNNIRTFNRVFKEVTGYTPTQFSSLTDMDTYNLTYYKRKSTEQQFVENDSMTVIKNSEKISN